MAAKSLAGLCANSKECIDARMFAVVAILFHVYTRLVLVRSRFIFSKFNETKDKSKHGDLATCCSFSRSDVPPVRLEKISNRIEMFK